MMQHNRITYENGWSSLFDPNYSKGVKNFMSYDYHEHEMMKSAVGSASPRLFEAIYKTSETRTEIFYQPSRLNDVMGRLGGLILVIYWLLLLISRPLTSAMLHVSIIDAMSSENREDDSSNDEQLSNNFKITLVFLFCRSKKENLSKE